MVGLFSRCYFGRYDAVTKNGALDWQNALSPENSHFFRSCFDGIFLNYSWTPELLASTQNQYVCSSVRVKSSFLFSDSLSGHAPHLLF